MVAHSFARCMLKTYVDDAVLLAPSEQNLNDLIGYETELLDLFSSSFKGVDVNNQPFKASTSTLDETGKLGICGYSYWPMEDCINIKSPRFTNRAKVRDKINPPCNNAPFYFEILTTRDQINMDYINHIFKKTPKTLRLVVSLGSQFFDSIGICNALTAQMRHTMGQAMIVSE